MTRTFMAQLIGEGATKRVVQDPARTREDFLHLQRKPPGHREHMPGTDRMAWRLGAKTMVLALGAAVGLCVCPLESFPEEKVRAAYQSATCSTGFCTLAQRWRKGRASQRKLGATSLGHSKRYQGLRRQPLASTPMAPSSMRQRRNKKSHQKQRTSFSTTTTTMTMLRIPRARAQLLRRQSCRAPWSFPCRTRRTLLVSAKLVRQASTETSSTNCFHADARPNVCSYRAVVDTCQASRQPPRSWR